MWSWAVLACSIFQFAWTIRAVRELARLRVERDTLLGELCTCNRAMHRIEAACTIERVSVYANGPREDCGTCYGSGECPEGKDGSRWDDGESYHCELCGGDGGCPECFPVDAGATLGERLMEHRAGMDADGVPHLSADEVLREVAERRGVALEDHRGWSCEWGCVHHHAVDCREKNSGERNGWPCSCACHDANDGLR